MAKWSKPTDARLRALEALVRISPQPASVSNYTGGYRIYWQSADRLVAEGLAVLDSGGDVHLTDAGRRMAAEFGITV